MISKDNKFRVDLEDEVVSRSIITHKGQKLWPNPKPLPMLDAKKKEIEQKVVVEADHYKSTI
jgi:hypothetical protein